MEYSEKPKNNLTFVIIIKWEPLYKALEPLLMIFICFGSELRQNGIE